MSDTNDWGDAAIATQPKANDWGDAPVAQPKMPDTSGVQQMVKNNLAANDNKETPEGGEPKPPPTPMQQAETGTGLPLQKILSGSAKHSDIDEANRTAYNSATKDGSVPDGQAWLQFMLHSTLPIIAGAARGNQYTGNALEGAKEDIFDALKPFKADNADDSAIRKGIEGLGQYVGGPVFGALGAAASPVTGGISAHSRSLTNLLQPDATEAQKQNLDQAIGGAITNVMLAAAPAVHGVGGKTFAAGDGPWSNLPGKEIITDHIAPSLGKESGQVTSDEIDSAITKGGKDLFPHPKDYEAIAAASGLKVDDLININNKTGKRPEEVYRDMQHDPSIAEDIGAGKIPEAYSHLLSPMRPDIEAAMKSVGEKAEAAKQESVTPATSKEYADDLYNRLHQKLGQDTATDIESMQRELQTKKVRASEVAEGHEFGVMIEAKMEIAAGDRIEAVRTVEKK